MNNENKKPHQLTGRTSLNLCLLFEGMIVGGAVDYILGIDKNIPKDLDIVIPLNKWNDACKLIPVESVSNSFGGFKFKDGPLFVDVWTDDICRVLLRSKSKGYSLLFNRIIEIYDKL